MRILFLLLIFIFYSVSAHSSEAETKRSDGNVSDFKNVDAPQFSVITTGYSAGTLEAMVVEGGDVFEVRTLAHPAVLVRHPKAGIELRIPRFTLCTDNGAMIAALGSQLIMDGREPSGLDFGAESTLPVTTVQTT